MSIPVPGVRYYYDPTALCFKAPSREDLPLRLDNDENFQPVSFGSLAEAREALGAPTNANYVMWTFGNTDLETVFASLTDNDILVLPERADAFGIPIPYLIDSSKGFMAAGVKEIDGTGSDGKKDGSRVPIVSNPRLWFSMTRARRGIIGLGPKVVIQPSESSFSAPRQPILENEPAGQQFQLRYMQDGTTAQMVGAAMKLMESAVSSPFFANFTMRSRSFGGVSYSALSMDGSGLKTVKRVNFDGCWRGHAGVPNGEVGGISILNGTYLIEHCDFRPVNGTSPIMWNRTNGGAVRHVRSTRPDYGMWTFWRCGGKNTFENVYLDSRQTGINLEEENAGFELEWTGGTFTLDYSGNKFHFAINPSNGTPKVTLRDVECSPNAWTAGAMTANNYGTVVASRSLITHNSMPVSCVPASKWTT